jgi:uncharacterized protein (DUF486 family)
VTVRLITSALTLLGASFMIFSMIYFKKLKTLSSRLIFQLTISAWGEALFNYITLFTYGKEVELSSAFLDFSGRFTHRKAPTTAKALFVS